MGRDSRGHRSRPVPSGADEGFERLFCFSALGGPVGERGNHGRPEYDSREDGQPGTLDDRGFGGHERILTQGRPGNESSAVIRERDG